MDNLTLDLEPKTVCTESYGSVYAALNAALLVSGFPATVLVIAKLLYRMYRSGSFSAAEVFLLQINVSNVFLFTSLLLHLLKVFHVADFASHLYIFLYSPTLTARPVFLLAMCAIFYLAVARPVTYMATKTWLRWEWLVVTLVWIYALLVNVSVITNRFDSFYPFIVSVFLINLPPTAFFNVATLRALSTKGPGDNDQTLNPAKRKAFWIVLGIQAFVLMFYMPRAYVHIYLFLVPRDGERFLCAEGMGMMLIPQISEFAMPVIFLYSLNKLDV